MSGEREWVARWLRGANAKGRSNVLRTFVLAACKSEKMYHPEPRGAGWGMHAKKRVKRRYRTPRKIQRTTGRQGGQQLDAKEEKVTVEGEKEEAREKVLPL